MRAVLRVAPAVVVLWYSLARAEVLDLDLARVQVLAERRATLVLRAQLDEEVARAQAGVEALGPMLAPSAAVIAGPCLNGRTTLCFQGGLSVPLPIPGEGRASRRIGGVRLASAASDRKAATWSIRFGASVVYVRLCAARELFRLGEEALRIVEEMVRGIRLRSRAGDAARVDELQASSRVLERRRELEEARLREQAAQDALRQLFAVSRATIRVREPLSRAAAAALRAASSAPALAEHPRLLAARARAELRRAQALLAGRRRWPRLSLEGSYQRDLDSHQFYVGLTIPLAPLSSVPDAKLQEARARERRAQREVEYLARELELTLAAARRQLEQRSRLRSAAEAEVARARELLALVQRGYELGSHDLVRVLVAEDALLRARREEITATRDLAEAALLVATGGQP